MGIFHSVECDLLRCSDERTVMYAFPEWGGDGDDCPVDDASTLGESFDDEDNPMFEHIVVKSSMGWILTTDDRTYCSLEHMQEDYSEQAMRTREVL